MPLKLTQGLNLHQVKVVVQWQVPKSTNMLVQHFGWVGCDNSIQAVAILFAEKGFFSHLRLEKKKAEFEASFCANLKWKHNSINNILPKCVALGECGNVHYSQLLTKDTNPFPHQHPNAIDAKVDDVGGGSGGNEEFRDDEGESKMDYALDGPAIPEEVGAKMKSE